jgi:hypothetical protein
MIAKRVIGRSCLFRRVCATSLLLTVVLLASNVWAQATDDDEDDDGEASSFASLVLRYDARGKADVTFRSNVAIQDSPALETALEQALRCPAGTLLHPRPAPLKFINSLSANR